jgi:hypothetical protein
MRNVAGWHSQHGCVPQARDAATQRPQLAMSNGATATQRPRATRYLVTLRPDHAGRAALTEPSALVIPGSIFNTRLIGNWFHFVRERIMKHLAPLVLNCKSSCHSGLIRIGCLGILFLMPGGWTTSATAEEPLRTAASRRIDVHHIRLDIELDLPKKHLQGRATIDFSPLPAFFEAAREPVIELDAHALDVSTVLFKKEGHRTTAVNFAVGEDKLLITAPQGVIETDNKYSVEIFYSSSGQRSRLPTFR